MQPFRVACCQLRSHDIEDAEANLQGILRALDEAGQARAHLVLLPECAYPAYFLRDADPYARPNVRPYGEVTRLLGEKAARYGYWLAAGLAVPHGNGRLTNSGVVFDPSGAVRGRYDKTLLWHFDTEWFEPGTAFPVWDTGFCRFGILICADGRQPEVARSLVVNGAEVLLDLTAWVSWGRDASELTNSHCEYLMPVRAFENGVWVAAADKWGTEDGTIVYAGRSSVIDPRGRTLVCAPTDQDVVVTYDIEPLHAAPVARRPALYGRLTMPFDDLPVAATLRESMVPADEDRRVAVVPGNGEFDARALIARYESLRRQRVDLVVFSGMATHEGWAVDLPAIEAAVRARGGAVAFGLDYHGCTHGQEAVLVTPGESVQHRATHGAASPLGEMSAPVVATPAGNVALLCGDEGLVPEVARCLALEGADILAWPIFAPFEMAERIARTRSDENRVYTAAAWPGGGIIIAPNGSPVTAVPVGIDVAMAAQVNKAMARWKDMAPGTNLMRDRRPEAYAPLTRP
ncbi:MAG: hydrolase [Dehalococcoidia bacterium]